MADELVTFDAKLDAIFKNLLATTAIFDTVEHARDAARKVRYQVRMVTLDGTELRTGGSYAGGANRQNNSIFIKPELEQLQKEIAQEEKLLSQEEEKLKTVQENLATLTQTLETIKSQGEQARIEEQGLISCLSTNLPASRGTRNTSRTSGKRIKQSQRWRLAS